MSSLPYGSDEPFAYLYNKTFVPDPSDGMETIGPVGDVLGIPLEALARADQRPPTGPHVQAAANTGTPAPAPAGQPGETSLSPAQERNMALARTAMSNPEVFALMQAIAGGEGDYDVLNGGARFAGWNYPERAQRAAGAYQIMPETYKGLSKRLGLTDFSPATQDLMAAYLIGSAKAHEPLLRGDLDGAIDKLRGIWTSLPGGAEPNARTMTFADRYRANLRRIVGE